MAVENLFSKMEKATEVVAAKKAALDALSVQVQAAATAHQEAVAAAEALYAQFNSAIGQHVPSARVR